MDNETREMARQEAEYADAQEFLRKFGTEEKGLDNFFLEIMRTDNTLKVGNLESDELGKPQIPLRTMLELADDCALIPSMSSFETELRKQSEIILASSLSKMGFLIKARITQKKEFLDKEKKKKVRTGLFGKKEVEEEI